VRFLEDMCVDVRIVKWLQEQEHDATHLRDKEQYRDKLKLQKKGLMQDLLTGKIRLRV
jgi:predicted nuclease of predicted toxin-antitoxin system